jgi:hypothetical protein
MSTSGVDIRWFRIGTRVGDSRTEHYLSYERRAQPVTIYANPGWTVTFNVRLGSFLGTPTFPLSGSISGVLIDP